MRWQHWTHSGWEKQERVPWAVSCSEQVNIGFKSGSSVPQSLSSLPFPMKSYPNGDNTSLYLTGLSLFQFVSIVSCCNPVQLSLVLSSQYLPCRLEGSCAPGTSPDPSALVALCWAYCHLWTIGGPQWDAMFQTWGNECWPKEDNPLLWLCSYSWLVFSWQIGQASNSQKAKSA